jgi:hypothetical protein
LLTFGIDAQLRPETEGPNGNVGGDSQQDVLGRFWWPLGLFVAHPRSWWKEETKSMDPQNQTSPLSGVAAVCVSTNRFPHPGMSHNTRARPRGLRILATMPLTKTDDTPNVSAWYFIQVRVAYRSQILTAGKQSVAER